MILFCTFRLIFKWCLFGSDSCSISSASCFRDYFPFFVCSYKNLLQIPCRSQEKRKFTIFLLAYLPFLSQPFGAVCVWVLFPFLYRHLLGDYLFFLSSFIFFSVKIRKQDGFVSVWFRLFAYFLCFFFMSVWVMYQKVV